MIARMQTSESFFSDQAAAGVNFETLLGLWRRSEEKNKFLSDENKWLREQLAELKRNRFGKKSERWESEEQLLLNEAEVESKKPEPDEEDADIEVKGYKKKRGHRKPLPESLE